MISLLSKQKGHSDTRECAIVSPLLSSDPAAVFSHLDGWYMAKGPDYSCAWWPTKLFTNVFDAGSISCHGSHFCYRFTLCTASPLTVSSIKGHWNQDSKTPSAQDKGTSWGHFKHSITQLNEIKKKANPVDGHSEAARLLCCVLPHRSPIYHHCLIFTEHWQHIV